MLAAGLVAKKAVERGLKAKPWVKASLAPGSKVVTDYLIKTDLLNVFGTIGILFGGLWLHDLHWQFRAFTGKCHSAHSKSRIAGGGGAIR